MDTVNLTPQRNIEKLYKKVEKNTIEIFSDFFYGSIYENSKDNILNQFTERLQLINKTY
jgi:hypothetical protein